MFCLFLLFVLSCVFFLSKDGRQGPDRCQCCSQMIICLSNACIYVKINEHIVLTIQIHVKNGQCRCFGGHSGIAAPMRLIN